MSTQFVRSDAAKNGFTWEISVARKKRKLEGTGTNPTGKESTEKNSMSCREGIQDLRRFNSLLDPALAVYDLDTFETNKEIFDDGEI